MTTKFSLSMLITVFFSALFIEAASDVSTWIHCAFSSDTCEPDTVRYREAAYTGLAVGSMFSLLGVYFAVGGQKASQREAISLVLSVLAGGLVSILKIAVDKDKHYPMFEHMAVALAFYLVVFAMLILSLLLREGLRMVTVARLALSVILALLLATVVFNYVTPALAGLCDAMQDNGRPYVLKPYAVVATSAAFAILTCIKSPNNVSADVPRWFAGLALFVALGLALLYGASPDLSDKTNNDRLLGMWIAVWHLFLPLLLATSVMVLSSLVYRVPAAVLACIFLAFVGYQMIGRLPTDVNVMRASLDLLLTVPLIVLCATLANWLIPLPFRRSMLKTI